MMNKSIPVFCKIALGLLTLITLNATAQPTVSSFTPSSGPIGTTITITGTNFNAVPASNIVFFGAVRATVTLGTATSLTVTAPAGATYRPISVLDNTTGLTGYSSNPFITTFTNPFGTGIPTNYYKPKVDFTTGTFPRSVAIGDVDGDGKPDMAVANANNNTVSVLRNTTTAGGINAASFAAKVDFATATAPRSVATADVDGDGKPDLVVVNESSNSISILRNVAVAGSISAASFSAKVDFTVGFVSPVFVAIGDVDGDGRPDLVTANSNAASVSVLRNTSTQGTITAASFAAKVDFSTGLTPYSVAIGDLDGDGKPELVLTNAAGNVNTVSVLRNTSVSGSISAASFAAKVDFATGATPRSVAIGDMDGDGKSDLVVANSATSPVSTTISVLRNTSTLGTITAASFAAKVDFTTGNSPYSVAIGDLDGDGKPDLVVANSATSSNSISVLRNTSTSGIIGTSSFAAKADFATGISPVSVAIGDVDGDGSPEISASNLSSTSVSVFQVNPSVLAVTITKVRAYEKNSGVQVEWTAQQESNIGSYEVERSANGLQFFKLGSVDATGSSSVAIDYGLFDANPARGVNFYRIKIIEPGQANYSQVLRVTFTKENADRLTIYPNPVNGNNIALQVNLQKGNYVLTLINKLGQQVATKLINHPGGSATENIRAPKALSEGVYQLRLSGGGINITRQVIKN